MTVNYVKPAPGESVVISFSPDGTTYTASGVFNTSRTITQSFSTNSAEVNDLNNLSNPAQTIRTAKALDMKIDGAGTMDVDNYVAVAQMVAGQTDAGIACKIKVMTPGSSTNSDITYTGHFFIESFALTGSTHELSTVSISLTQASAPTIVVTPVS